MLKNCRKNKAGFTLLELLVVVLIIGILAAIALPQYKYIVAKAKFTQLLTASKAIVDAQRRYMLVYGERSLDLSVLDIDMEGGTYTKARTENDAISFDWGQCNIAAGSLRNSIVCWMSNPYIAYYNFFEKNRQACCASAASGELGKKLCQAEFPKATGQDTDSHCGVGGTRYANY